MTQLEECLTWVLALGTNDEIPFPKDETVVVELDIGSCPDWARVLHPTVLGPLPVYGDYVSQNMLNAWTYCKVFKQLVGPDGEPTDEYWEWAKNGWASKVPVDTPFGSSKPEYVLFEGKKIYQYVQGRIEVNIPFYTGAVVKTKAFKHLQDLYEKAKKEKKCLVLRDQLGCNAQRHLKSYKKIIYNASFTVHHGLMLAMLLDNQRVWEEPFDPNNINNEKVPGYQPPQ